MRIHGYFALRDHTESEFRGSRNLVTFDSVTAITKLLAGDLAYAVTTVYLEFDNSNSGPVTTPVINADDDAVAYYAALAGNPHRDYLRVPVLSASTRETVPNSGRFDVLEVHTVTQGTAGVHGRGFSHTFPSRIYGAALVASPGGSPSQDIIVARKYLSDGSMQREKSVDNPIYGLWEWTFDNPV